MTADLPVEQIAFRLAAATLSGMALGLDRDLRGKPTGIRTLGLVALGAALVAVGTAEVPMLREDADALSRVVQGLIQGLMAGVGFIGAGAILRDPEARRVRGMTTAANVWAVAAIGLAFGLGAWTVGAIGFAIAFFLLVVLPPIERALDLRD